MKKNGHLTFEDKTPALKGTVNWIMPIDFTAYITKEGLDYYYSRTLQMSTLEINSSNSKLIESNLELNKAIRENLKWQKWLAIATVIVAALAALFSFLSYQKPEPKMAELNKNIRLLSNGLEGIKTELNRQKSLPVSTTDSSHKH